MQQITTSEIEQVNTVEDEEDFPINFKNIYEAQMNDKSLQQKKNTPMYSSKKY
jgi:hypothetical protein